MIAKKPCKNDATFSFTGKESSPLGLGYSASAEQVGSMMTGRDQTMWMVGIKNGVKVWNRVPTEIAAAAAPLEKDVPVLEHDKKSEGEEDKAVESVPPVKKKTVVRKKAVVTTAQEPEEAKQEIKTIEEEEVADVVAAKPKKRVVKKKKEAEPVAEESREDEDVQSDTTSNKEAPAKAKRKPSSFNIFMSYRMKMMSKEDPNMSHKEKFGKAAAEWRTMDEDAKKVALEKAMEAV